MITLNRARQLYNDIEYIAKNNGFITSIYGSVVRDGQSNKDLDIILNKYVEHPATESVIQTICSYFHGEIINTYQGLFAKSYIIEIGYDNINLDIQIRD